VLSSVGHDGLMEPTFSDKDLQDLSDLLDRVWDPIGVYQGPDDGWAPAGEYGSYAPAVLQQLHVGVSTTGLARYFRTIEETQMGLRPSGMERRTAEDVVDWFNSRRRS
jgi:hypothetical protein